MRKLGVVGTALEGGTEGTARGLDMTPGKGEGVCAGVCAGGFGVGGGGLPCPWPVPHETHMEQACHVAAAGNSCNAARWV